MVSSARSPIHISRYYIEFNKIWIRYWQLGPQICGRNRRHSRRTTNERKYERVKTALIKRVSDSTSHQIQKVLEREELGDRTPSRFLGHLRGIAGKTVPEEFVKELSLSRLPTDTQKALATTTAQTLDNLAEGADRVHEIDTEKTHITHISTQVSSNDKVTALRKEVEESKLHIQEIGRKKVERQRSRSPR